MWPRRAQFPNFQLFSSGVSGPLDARDKNDVTLSCLSVRPSQAHRIRVTIHIQIIVPRL